MGMISLLLLSILLLFSIIVVVFTRKSTDQTNLEMEFEACSRTTGKCTPCESLDRSDVISDENVRERLLQYPLWSFNDNLQLSRKFTAKNFVCAMDFINAVARIAEDTGHHPDIHVTSYRNVEIVLYTHSLKGITENDFSVASKIDAVPVVYSPQWIKSNPHAKGNPENIVYQPSITSVEGTG